MKSLATAITAIALIGTPAFAADMAVKAPLPAPAPVYNWTGWYAGVNLGASFGRVKTDFNADPVTLGGILTIPGFSQSDILYPDGFIGGGQIGYNWQVSPIWVIGLEADIQGALEKDSASFTKPFSVTQPLDSGLTPLFVEPTVSATGTSVLNYTAKIDWFGTVRGRVGYLWGDGTVLSYVTGGLAYGKVELDATSTVSGTVTSSGLGAPAPLPFSVTHVINQSEIKTGWVVGFGTEGKLLIPNWTYKIETLYIDFGDPTALDICLDCSSSVKGGFISGNAHYTDWILRAGVNYQFH